jgi:hypothetical protein
VARGGRSRGGPRRAPRPRSPVPGGRVPDAPGGTGTPGRAGLVRGAWAGVPGRDLVGALLAAAGFVGWSMTLALLAG